MGTNPISLDNSDITFQSIFQSEKYVRRYFQTSSQLAMWRHKYSVFQYCTSGVLEIDNNCLVSLNISCICTRLKNRCNASFRELLLLFRTEYKYSWYLKTLNSYSLYPAINSVYCLCFERHKKSHFSHLFSF